MSDPYLDREQTKTKHFLLKHYLQALAFKVLHFFDLTYVDGFSGPWETETEDFTDTSFMIAISVLKDAQRQIFDQTGRRPKVRCFFSEKSRAAFTRLNAAVAQHNRPQDNFEIKTFFGNFEDAIGDIERFIDGSFPLIFVDPTGWTGYPLNKIKPLFGRPKCEVLINFMYDFVNRAASMRDEKTLASLNPISEGPAGKIGSIRPCRGVRRSKNCSAIHCATLGISNTSFRPRLTAQPRIGRYFSLYMERNPRMGWTFSATLNIAPCAGRPVIEPMPGNAGAKKNVARAIFFRESMPTFKKRP